MKTKTVLLVTVIFLLLSVTAWAQLNKGPYLQNLASDGVVVCFETDSAGVGAVEYGLDPFYGQTSYSDGEEFTFDGNTVYQYKIPIADCAPDTVYHYRVIHGGVTTPDFTYATAPDDLLPFRFVVVGDTRGGSIQTPNPEHSAIVDAILQEAPDFVLNTGDLVSSGAILDDWEYFFYEEMELMSYLPMYPTFGNHEDDWENGLSGDRNWRRYFDLPNSGNHPTWYSFDYVNVHFLIIDVEKDLTLALPGISQNAWIRDDLEAFHENEKTNFVFTFFHEPPFSYKDGRSGNLLSMMVLQPIFIDYEVDASFEGHDHFYAHTVMGGIDHFVTGGGGAPLYDFQTWPLPENMPGYRAHDKSNNYMVIDVFPDMVEIRAYRLDGTLIDEKIIEKDPPVWPVDDDTVDDDIVDDDIVDDDIVDDDIVDDDVIDDDVVDDDVVDDDVVDDDVVDDDIADDDIADDDAADDDAADDDVIGDDDQAPDDDAVDDDQSINDDDDDGCGC